MRQPAIIQAGAVLPRNDHLKIQVAEGLWVHRPIQMIKSFAARCKAAWLVFSGQADALVWKDTNQ